MSVKAIRIRTIQPEDNPALEEIIKSIFPEFGMPLVGTAYEDSDTTNMYSAFNEPGSAYFVLEREGDVLGGAGIKPLVGGEKGICELQKMYFKQEVRGMGFGRKMLNRCLETAIEMGYQKCYLESATALKAAINMYEKNGFQYLNNRMGNTGHYSCGVWMLKEL